jgi:hypothetical protein
LPLIRTPIFIEASIQRESQNLVLTFAKERKTASYFQVALSLQAKTKVEAVLQRASRIPAGTYPPRACEEQVLSHLPLERESGIHAYFGSEYENLDFPPNI